MAYTILMYDEIGPGFWGMLDAKWMAAELDKAGGGEVDLRINSPGGSVFEGDAMYNAILRYPGKVTTHIDGIAASMASVIALAGSEVLMAENAMYMIHPAQGMAYGPAAEMRRTADLLEKYDQKLVEIYTAHTEQSKEQISEWVQAETWMTAQEALDRGFIDRIGQPLSVKACVREGQFAKTPKDLLVSASSVSPRVQAASNARRLALARAVNT